MRSAAALRAGLGLLVATALVVTGCATVAPAVPGDGSAGPVRVVAVENFWGSLAEQLGGDRAEVTSIISNPDADPHDYEPTAADARTIASAQLLVVNGVGYDTWASRTAAANPSAGRVLLDVGELLGVPVDGNPHRWYCPDDVRAVVTRITADLAALAPASAAYFRGREDTLLTSGLAGYHAAIASIRTRFGGVAVAASESIFALMAPSLGLRLLTPPGFLRSVSEGTDPTPADRSAADRLIAGHEVSVYVYNSQNATPDIQRQLELARASGVPVVRITETLTPAGATFQAWQTAQLDALAVALSTATGR
jgi:zinc/manganese transport system substrate-binding protein